MGSDTGDAHLRLPRRGAAGLASAGSLAAAALCALVIAADNVTFDGWPGDISPAAPGAATVADAGSGASRPASVRDAAESTAAPPRAARADAGARARTDAPRRTPLRDRRARGTARRARAGAPVAASGPAPVRGGRPPAPPPAPARPVRDAAVAVAATVRSGGRTAGAVVGRVSPEAGAALTSTTDAVAAQLDAVAEQLP